MTEFSHSEVLLTGDDGLPILFNIQNTTEKEFFKSLIEYSGGMCTLSDDAIILVSPGTKVLSVQANKNLISSRYLLDCVKEDCLLDTDEYRIEINEMEASDFSDSSNLQGNSLTFDSNKKVSEEISENSVDLIQPITIFSPSSIIFPKSNHDFDFEDSENQNSVVEVHKINEQTNHGEFSLQSSDKHIDFDVCLEKVDDMRNCSNSLPNTAENFKQSQSVNKEQKKISNKNFSTIENRLVSNHEDPVTAVVSSSQEKHGVLDQFDDMILKKVEEKSIMGDDEDPLSQSNTVSSSADAHISSNQHTSAEMFNGSSASLTSERQQYIDNLEKEIEQILKKPSPKSVQDKTVLVKYISTVKKLSPAIVLQTLQTF